MERDARVAIDQSHQVFILLIVRSVALKMTLLNYVHGGDVGNLKEQLR